MDDLATEPLLRVVLAGGPAAPRRELLDAHVRGGPAGAREAAQARGLLPAIEPAAVARALAWLDDPGHHLVGWHDPAYPPLLREAPNPPVALFVSGDPWVLWQPMVAVVGSRNPTAGGRASAEAFAEAFARAGYVVVSGLAAGIDACGHQAALAAGHATVAVTGCGPDLTYPAAHRGLSGRVAATGALVTEYPPGTPPRAEHFPSRNRIVAGLALGTVVVEAALRSGALVTARLANECSRDVFALPGSIHNPMVRGCHRLIREGALLVETPAAVMEVLAECQAARSHASTLRVLLGRGPAGPAAPQAGTVPDLRLAPGAREDARHPPAQAALPLPLEAAAAGPTSVFAPDDADHQQLWAALGHDPTGMDALVHRTGLTASQLSAMLLVMELQGRVTVEHGRYSRHAGLPTSTASRDAGRGQ